MLTKANEPADDDHIGEVKPRKVPLDEQPS